jgi:hypothetical protein
MRDSRLGLCVITVSALKLKSNRGVARLRASTAGDIAEANEKLCGSIRE